MTELMYSYNLWNEEGAKLFESTAFIMLKQAHPMLPMPYEDAYVMIMDAFKVDQEKAPVEEVMRFQKFVTSWKLDIPVMQVEKIVVSLQIPYQKGFQTIAIEGAFPITFDADKEVTQQSLDLSAIELTQKLFRVFSAVQSAGKNAVVESRVTNAMNLSQLSNGQLPETVPQQQSMLPQANNAGFSETFLGRALEVSMRDNKTEYRIRIDAPQYAKYGVVVYPEVLQTAVAIDQLSIGSYTLGRNVEVTKNAQGKAKVTRII